MYKIFEFFSVCILFIIIAMLINMFLGHSVYDKLNALFVINTNIIIIILSIGFFDGRIDMYIDIALSYSILGFVTTVILAKYIGGRR